MIIYQKLSALFDYPGSAYFDQLDEAENLIYQFYTANSMLWLKYSQMIQTKNLGELQEHFIASFDVKANSSLDIGHILFGEDNKRNGFLINLKEEHAKVQYDCGSEMPDYLPNLLSLMAISEDSGFNEELAVSIILPALRLMNSGLGKSDNHYTVLIDILIQIIENEYQDTNCQEYVPIAKSNCNFSKNSCHHG